MAILTGAYDPNAEAQKDFAKLPTGEYVAHIIDSDMKPTSGNNGHFLELTYEVLEGPLKGSKHWERLNLDNPNAKTVEIANRQFASIREATGVANPRDSQELHRKPHVIRVEFQPAGSKKSNGTVRDRDEASIKAWKKLEGGAGNGQQATSTTHSPSSAPATSASPSSPPWKKAA